MCEICTMRDDFPLCVWEVELHGGPCDGRVFNAPSMLNGLPHERIYAVAETVPSVTFPATNTANQMFPRRSVYCRGEAISEDTHRWPYMYIGTAH